MENPQETVNKINNVQETLKELQQYLTRINYAKKLVDSLGIDVNKSIDHINNADPNKYNPIIGKLLKAYQAEELDIDGLVNGMEEYLNSFNSEELTPVDIEKYNKLKEIITFYKNI